MKQKQFQITLIIYGLLVTTVLAYFPALTNGFINLGDDLILTQNQVIRQLSWETISYVLTHAFHGFYQPLSLLVLALQYHLFQLTPMAYHIANVLLHALNVVLIFWFVFLLSDSLVISTLTALTFSLHPIHVDAVAWVYNQKELLSASFFLVAILCFLCYRKHGERGFLRWSLAAAVASVLSQPLLAITLPLILILIDYSWGYFSNFKEEVRKTFPFVVLSLCSLWLNASIRSDWNLLPVQDNFAVIRYGIVFYLSKILLPIDLAFGYPLHEGASDTIVLVLAPFVVSIIIGLVLYSVSRTKKIVFGCTWFLLLIISYNYFLHDQSTLLANHRVYLSSAGIFYLFAESVRWAWVRYGRGHAWIVLAVGGLTVYSIFFSLSRQRCNTWLNGVSLWTDMSRVYPQSTFALNNRGLAHLAAMSLDSALSDFDKSIVYNPRDATSNDNRGNLFLTVGKIEQALADFSRAIDLRPDFALAYYNKGTAYSSLEQNEKAIAEYSRALDIDPNLAQALNNRGNAFARLGRYSLALADYGRATALDPKYADAINNRAFLFLEVRNYADALDDLSAVATMQPNRLDVWVNRGLLYLLLAEEDRAAADLLRAHKISTSFASVYLNLQIKMFVNSGAEFGIDAISRIRNSGLSIAPDTEQLLLGKYRKKIIR